VPRLPRVVLSKQLRSSTVTRTWAIPSDRVGLAPAEATFKALDTITRVITSSVVPLVSFTIERVPLEGDRGRAVIRVGVNPGTPGPYGINPEMSTLYVRRGATTFPASADQVRQGALSKTVTNSPGPFERMAPS
jgi:hypothetical protein